LARGGDTLPIIEPGSRAGWRDWLAAHHSASGSVWVVLPKKGSGRAGPSAVDVSEEALCFGWIDSLPRKLDAERSLLLVSPRKAGSLWSALNKARAERLIAEGRMTPAGLARIEAARADGTWSALDAVEALEVPPDLAFALAARPGAAAIFASFPRSTRRGILEWILQARTPVTRARRIAETAAKAEAGERANQWRRPEG
jgi:uncharacterized protein YdeI (YjbR/CyaY-like superfamily)